MDPALVLGGGRPALELELPRVHHGAEDGETTRPDILTPVLQSSMQISNLRILFGKVNYFNQKLLTYAFEKATGST